MSILLNRAGHTVATTGTGTITLGAALGAVSPNTCSFQSFGTAGAVDGNVFSYLILDSNGAWEYGTGTYTAAGTTLSRVLEKSSTGSLLSLTGSAQVFITARAADLAKIAETNTYTADQILMVGTTAKAPLNFQSGTNLTTPAAGAMEYDGKVPYFTHAANERGVVPSVQWIRLSSTYTLTSQTAVQKLFNISTNGAVTVAGGTTYEFECEFSVASLSASSGTFGFAIGGTATLTSIKWDSQAEKVGGLTVTGNSPQQTTSVTASLAALVANNTSTVGKARIQGIICVNAGGTIIPQVSMTVAAAAVVDINSFFKLWPIGTNTQTTLGNWS